MQFCLLFLNRLLARQLILEPDQQATLITKSITELAVMIVVIVVIQSSPLFQFEHILIGVPR